MAKLGDTVKGARVLSARVRAAEGADPEGRMSLIDHIRELRNRVVKIASALVVGTGVGLVPRSSTGSGTSSSARSARPRSTATPAATGIGDQLVLNGVLDPFMLRVEVAFFFGLVLTSPIWLYQIWAFVAPGLYRREKRWTYAFVGTAVPLFLVGARDRLLRDEPGPGLPARPDPARASSTCRRSPPTSATSSACCSASGWPSSCRCC